MILKQVHLFKLDQFLRHVFPIFFKSMKLFKQYYLRNSSINQNHSSLLMFCCESLWEVCLFYHFRASRNFLISLQAFQDCCSNRCSIFRINQEFHQFLSSQFLQVANQIFHQSYPYFHRGKVFPKLCQLSLFMKQFYWGCCHWD